MGIYTCYTGKNDTLIDNVCEMYAPQGCKIADVTWGKGAFWKKRDISKYDFFASDKKPKDSGIYPVHMCFNTDFRSLPYERESMDVVVLDPPYAHTPGRMMVDSTYNNEATTKGMYHTDIIKMYADGMKEAARILKVGGTLWVKCQDEIQSGKQCWSHIEIKEDAESIGFYSKDLFILHQDGNPVIQVKEQKHARRNHSYLWIFEKQ